MNLMPQCSQTHLKRQLAVVVLFSFLLSTLAPIAAYGANHEAGENGIAASAPNEPVDNASSSPSEVLPNVETPQSPVVEPSIPEVPLPDVPNTQAPDVTAPELAPGDDASEKFTAARRRSASIRAIALRPAAKSTVSGFSQNTASPASKT